MARRCPITNELVLYLECMDCDQKDLCRSLSTRPAPDRNPTEGEDTSTKNGGKKK